MWSRWRINFGCLVVGVWWLVIGGWSMGGKWSNWGRQAVEMGDLIWVGGASGLFLCLLAHFFGWGKVAGEGWLVIGRDGMLMEG
jgi:hypothetical protein